MKKHFLYLIFVALFSCSKTNSGNVAKPSSETFSLSSIWVNGTNSNDVYYINFHPVIKLFFSDKVNHSSINNFIILVDSANVNSALDFSYSNNDSTVTIQPQQVLKPLSKYTLKVFKTLQSQSGGALQAAAAINLITQIDSTPKFPSISDSELLDLVQKQTFKYFWDFAHPTSGMARERNTSGDIVTIGGTGFGIMSMIVAVKRNFISRNDAVMRIQKIVSFLKNNCTAYHGTFSHWINGSTGATVPFNSQDDGGDIVETSYLMEGLLCVRQYFNASSTEETTLRNDINTLWNNVDWTWYENNQNVLYWLWSNDNGWENNTQVQGWNEALITYVLAASSNNHAIEKSVYDNGWARNGAIKNGNTSYGIVLPLGENLGGPLFYEHYSFLGINPSGLSDAYADYALQTKNHSLINHAYCKANPNGYFGYSDTCWGLTASDIQNGGYNVSSPTNDVGVISPTAAIASLPYTPTESMNALRFFYYELGNKLWGNYGFVDAFSLKDLWFADSYLAIDQGPEIVMIENYRSGLLWSLFTSCDEVKRGMKRLGFRANYLN
ncbi:beta-glucosidase [Arachidicoccus ginsenosidimutans]|uniref:glucoamylase family protein n=1 Tax=Arachidicoccus sp. BS20 TaxID=1850526 RepID=UPI0007F186C6|nr:glucoamylase family protein [Arachidicoccus sp. BS20]ANI90151.1 beta-glucosidase [Arachidicoccus sp. BS20]